MDVMNQGDAERETPAGEGGQRSKLSGFVAVVLSAVILVIGLCFCLISFLWWTKAPEEDQQTSKTSVRVLTDHLEQCQRERHNLTLMIQAATEDSRCRLCPDGWLWWRSSCYFFSVGQENLQWNESAEFCQQHNSSLTVIQDAAEMEFIQGVMRSFPKFPFLWVGLTDTQQESQWLWWDGTDIQHYMPLTVEWDSDHRDCADLRGGGSLFAADCEDYGPWTCKKDS